MEVGRVCPIMVFETSLGADFNQLITDPEGPGRLLRIQYYTQTIGGGGSYFDDDVSLSKSGSDVWASGIILPVQGKEGTNEALLMEQGLLSQNSVRLYVNGSLSLSGTFKVGLGFNY